MHAIGFTKPGPLSAPDALVDFEVGVPTPGPRDILVRIEAISVNPADVKVRASATPPKGQPRILGWDGAGTVVATGAQVESFKVGDEVFFAGDISRPGSYADFTLVDERLVARKPQSLDWAEAAAMPLTMLTAWEGLFERLGVGHRALTDAAQATGPAPGAGEALLVIGGAGGVGSSVIQLASALTGLTVVATASRPETACWATRMGAHHIIDHHGAMVDEYACLSLPAPRYVFSTQATDRHLGALAELIAPEGAMVMIDDPEVLNVTPFKRKSVGVHWEFMFTRPLLATPTMARQGEILKNVATLLDAKVLRTTAHTKLAGLNATTLKLAHGIVESNRAVGKVVITR
ncbi:zinc-binding alcohol dehydrogenase family protein [Formicincola oecophyllae]|uniref:Zinc-type alcohol dehydrogenase-like protein n=1 Tax=Formicincola oecophyllae TaxID=2558361 RepID=A0A4Y6UDK1_9PROT|nr:zinc-binding alcohol dehydrogenase family protein [Formicincola oecophyllae]QDH14481.1 zinc-binding alcohol dehydrogenase family protein [Formicincola oecophyllae]